MINSYGNSQEVSQPLAKVTKEVIEANSTGLIIRNDPPPMTGRGEKLTAGILWVESDPRTKEEE